MAHSFLLVLTIAAICALLPHPLLQAQSLSPPCGFHSDAIHLADLPVNGEFPLQSTIWHFDESIWLTPDGNTIHFLDPASIRLIGTDEGLIDLLSFSAIVDLLAIEGTRQSINSGYVSPGDIVEVRTPACVSRSGSGAATRFFPCGPDCCTRTYLVLTLLPGTVAILPLIEEISLCSPAPDGCEQGCNGLPSVP